ncbi:hypothetical protein [Ramlibacter sp.]|uniref:hypothetical protein n=1 Tax=Ramlibacter sp. TaxID=1917967 RepID=UPI002BF2E9EA|nr:hypothetical protein [Ramlibacter sp.]HWI83555.1 hypothetical protein [Ramlibacter sp.]
MVTHTSWLSPVVRRLPARLVATLDAWSYRIALQRAERRRAAGQRRAQVLAQQRSGA